MICMSEVEYMDTIEGMSRKKSREGADLNTCQCWDQSWRECKLKPYLLQGHPNLHLKIERKWLSKNKLVKCWNKHRHAFYFKFI